MPAEIFGAVGAVAVRLVTCEGRPVIDAVRSLGLLEPKQDCDVGDTRPFRVAVSTVMGGSIMYARIMVEVAFQVASGTVSAYHVFQYTRIVHNDLHGHVRLVFVINFFDATH